MIREIEIKLLRARDAAPEVHGNSACIFYSY
jgi:hypothetical protein